MITANENAQNFHFVVGMKIEDDNRVGSKSRNL
jgi:hypothetical protein